MYVTVHNTCEARQVPTGIHCRQLIGHIIAAACDITILWVQVPKKMTCNEFIRNNRGINGGDNLPQDFLTSLYENISKNEIKISTEAVNTAEASPILWSELNLQSKSPRGQMLEVTSHSKWAVCLNHSTLSIK